MDKKQIPVLSIIKTGETFKVYEVTGQAGMAMPSHHSTKEAVVYVKEGTAILKILGKEHLLEKESVFIIPEKQIHSLELRAKFKAIVIMEKDSNIEFDG
jgi:quercetin dioxygenase-like cupin family protein